MVIMEQVGRHLLVAPLLASAIIGTSAVAKAASRAQMEKLLPALASGEQRTAVALSEPGHAGLPGKFATSANESGNPATGHALGSNFAFIGWKDDPRTGRCVIVSAIDNLVKGASGMAVQNMNLMLGIDETTGLTQLPLFP